MAPMPAGARPEECKVLAAVVVQILGSQNDHFEFAEVHRLNEPWALRLCVTASLVPWSTIQKIGRHLLRNPLDQIITPMIKGNPLARLWEGVEGVSLWGRIRSPFPARINFSERPKFRRWLICNQCQLT